MKFQLMTVICLTLAGLNIYAEPSSIDKDGMLIVGGQRCFILGLYENAPTAEFADEVAQAGFNLIRSKASKEALDIVHAHGMQCWIALGGLPVSNEDLEKKLRDTIEAYKNHPALAVWEAPDEALWNVWWRRWNSANQRWRDVENAVRKFQGTPEQKKQLKGLYSHWRSCQQTARYAACETAEEEIRTLTGMKPATEKLSEWRQHIPLLYNRLKRGTDIVRETDSSHVIWFNHAPRNSMADLTSFGQLGDIVGCDIYPVPFGPDVGHSDLAERNRNSVGRYTQRMAASAPGKPVWMVLQGFGWDDLAKSDSRPDRPRPTYSQSRFMAYDTIVNGARGLLYWGTHTVEKDSKFWMELKALVSELRDMQPFLSAPDVKKPMKLVPHPSAASDEKGIRMLVKKVENQWAFFLVNEADSAMAFDITGLDKLNGKTVIVQGNTESMTVENGRITYGLAPRTAAVLLTK